MNENGLQEVKIDLSFLLSFMMVPAGGKLIAIAAIAAVEPSPQIGGLTIHLTGGHSIELTGPEAIEFCRNGAEVANTIKLQQAKMGMIR